MRRVEPCSAKTVAFHAGRVAEITLLRRRAGDIRRCGGAQTPASDHQGCPGTVNCWYIWAAFSGVTMVEGRLYSLSGRKDGSRNIFRAISTVLSTHSG